MASDISVNNLMDFLAIKVNLKCLDKQQQAGQKLKTGTVSNTNFFLNLRRKSFRLKFGICRGHFEDFCFRHKDESRGGL